jgi:hypothetical protein
MRSPTIARLGFASLLGALAAFTGTSAQADTAATTPPVTPSAPSCDAASGTCSVGTAALRAELRNQLPTKIDSGVMDKGLIKIRTRFTIDPVAGDPLVAIDMPKGALVEASWNEKGFVNLKPVTEASSQGTIAVHYTLTPSLEASIYGFNVNYNAAQLINMIPGAKFNYDQKASGTVAPWGFVGGSVAMPAPALDQSTLFSLPFSQLGVDSDTVTGSLSIQAAAKPSFNYLTKSVLLDSGSITAADGSTKISVGDADFLDVGATVAGQITVTGDLEIRPVIKIDSVYGFPTFGLTKFSFSAVKKAIGGGEPVAVAFQNANIHIPLPNVKVPATPIGLGDVKAGSTATKTISIDSTGEMGAKLQFTSSDPQFVVPSGRCEEQVRPQDQLQALERSGCVGDHHRQVERPRFSRADVQGRGERRRSRRLVRGRPLRRQGQPRFTRQQRRLHGREHRLRLGRRLRRSGPRPRSRSRGHRPPPSLGLIRPVRPDSHVRNPATRAVRPALGGKRILLPHETPVFARVGRCPASGLFVSRIWSRRDR